MLDTPQGDDPTSGRAHGSQVRAQEGLDRASSASTWSPPNGQAIATSEAYESKASAINGIESVKRNATNAEVDDQTDK
jgi:hypothetical protein